MQAHNGLWGLCVWCAVKLLGTLVISDASLVTGFVSIDSIGVAAEGVTCQSHNNCMQVTHVLHRRLTTTADAKP